jgi:hypothetical protein
MKTQGHKKVKAKKKNYQAKKEDVFKIDDNQIIDVKKGESLDIELDSEGGFTVFIPFAGLFEPVGNSDQIFEAFEVNPIDVDETITHKLWRVRLQRKNEDNPGRKNFAYCIYSHELDNFAVASSPPKMNLDP